ncbi:HesA/MoeB/ThiF family protein [uncultured Pseudoteredinibacter sp.]|uniref:HesA/MoeB/ThiF family protein n=1 Tax=uncultured Pseudoteredinibacter sp. TaxID=1641701 RepID=UPI002622B0D8|nr:HesA/MoeB/ThiF family protein [uncultured Pseudoteredinibacter sp.]
MPSKENLQLSQQEQQRYLRQTQLLSFGESGQLKLKQSKVLIIGVGGLGCPAAQYLTAAGIGEITLVDEDQVSLSNLQRQILFSESDIGKNKAQAAKEKLQTNNSDIKIIAFPHKLNPHNAHQLIKRSDLVLDCTDNFHSRYLINDICAHYNKPWVYASVLGFEGQVALIKPEHSCFRCLYPELAETPNCNQAGVLGVVPGIVGNMQALLAIDYLARINSNGEASKSNKLQLIQGLNSRSINLFKSDDCQLCRGEKTYLDYTSDYQAYEQLIENIPEEQKISWADFEKFPAENTVLIDVRSEEEHLAFNRGGINIPLEELGGNLRIEVGKRHVFYCQSGRRSQLAHIKTLSLESDSISSDKRVYSITEPLLSPVEKLTSP